MKEKIRTLEKASYELDHEFSSLFCELNNAKFANKEGIEFVGPDKVLDDEGETVYWYVRIQQGLKIGEVMDRIPFGILNKTITGLGATTLEIVNQKRNSIIVVPTKALAYNKAKYANRRMGEGYALYVGSPIKDKTSNISLKQIQIYLSNNQTQKKKFLVVADSLPSLIKILIKQNIDVYNEYFLMVDEIDTMQADSVYRPRLENVMDYYFKFNRENRSAVSATFNGFSNPALKKESMITTSWKENPTRNIDLIHTNYVDDTALKIIKQKLSTNPNDKILIAYNSLDGILNILTLLKKENLIVANQSDYGILCSERNNDKIKEYIEDTDNVIDEEAHLQKKIVFMTCAYFAGIDIQDQCHLITITSHLQPFTYLSTLRMTQIAGRCRNGNLSETIIYDIPRTTVPSIYKDENEYQKSLISRAKTYADFLNSMREAIRENPELTELGNFIDSFVDYSAKAKVTNNSYPIKIVRQDCIENQFTPSYFNIDALTEKWCLVHSLYANEHNLYNKLVEDNQNVTVLSGYYMNPREHDSSSLSEIKERNKERRAEILGKLRTELLDWNRKGRNESQFQEIYKSQEKKIQRLCDEFKKLSLYINDEILFDGLSEHYKDGRKLRNYVNAAVFHVMPDDNAFKAHVLAIFNFSEIQQQARNRGVGRIKRQEKITKLKSAFRVQFKRTNISDDILAEFFTCFFKTSRSGGIDKIVGLNPLDLPTPIQYINESMNLLSLFIFP